jgi:ubiquinone/menaquinone biosynthesis C-methylase UbiE
MSKYKIIIFSLLTIILLSGNVSFAQNSYRDRQMQPEKIMDSVGIKPGMIIGEAGAGGGYFTFWISKRVGETGTVYANDIDKKELNKLKNKCEEENITNIQTVVGEIDNPLFPVDSLDMVTMMTAFHDFTKPVEWMNNVKKYLKPDAKLVIIDGDPEKLNSNRGHFLTQKEVLDIMKKTDFELVKIETFLVRDNIYIFKFK